MNFTKPSRRRAAGSSNGPVRYMDGSALTRPFDPPKYVMAVCVVAGIIAAVIGGTVASKAIDQILHGSEREAQTVAANIARDVSYDIPVMQNYLALDDASILQSFADSGFTVYSFLPEGEAGVDVFKIPTDTTLDEAAVAFANGLSSMSAIDASKFLVGSWRFTCDRSEYLDMRIRYADLQASDAQLAIDGAMASQGWVVDETVTQTAEGTDEIGNTYREGFLYTDAGTFIWRVSVCNLSEVYSISGLPASAQYVGIRLTPTA